MPNLIESVDVILWGTKIGTVIWHNNLGYFEYDQHFQHSGIELSPITMPLSNKSYAFSALNKETFKGLPGLLADSLPDKFGNQLIDQWLERQGRDKEGFSPIERLCYIGKRGMGALEFVPTLGTKKEKSFTLQINELVQLANDALNQKSVLNTALTLGDKNKQNAIEQIITVGTSAGGARAKAVIALHEKTKEIRSGQTPAGEGFSYWLLKFDGVDNNKDKETLSDPKGFGILEYAYYLMAIDAGIDMSECRLLKENGRAHFMTKRFDRIDGGEKIHMQSLCGLCHFDFNSPSGYSYEQAIGTMRDLRLPQDQITQFYRRMVFNVIARNQDDHTKNIAFLMDQNGQWRLSPAYDITYCNGSGWTKQHQMTINGKTNQFTLSDLLAVALHADITQAKAKKIISEVNNSVCNWPVFAEQSGLLNYNAINSNNNSLNNLTKQISQFHRTNMK